MNTTGTMTSTERVSTTLGHQEPDRVPLLLPTILQGARELGLSIREYFSSADHVIEGQQRLRARYRGDGLFGFLYAAQEIEAWGGETVFIDDGPPNAGAPVIRSADDIEGLEPPRVEDSAVLVRVLEVISGLKDRVGDDAPILGVAIAPFSLPVMQMGFEAYLDLMHDRPPVLERLLRINEAFCVEWCNAQLAAGATAISYTDPVSSPSIVPPALARQYAFPSAARVLGALEGPAAAGLAAGRCLPILDDIAGYGAVGVSASCHEDLAQIKAACAGRLTVMGNLNAIEMRRWTADEAERQVRAAIAAAAPGGGFVLTDNHGEIPWQVPDEILEAISEAVHRWGRYPLDEP